MKAWKKSKLDSFFQFAVTPFPSWLARQGVNLDDFSLASDGLAERNFAREQFSFKKKCKKKIEIIFLTPDTPFFRNPASIPGDEK